jgi:hypothetical protein
LLVEEESDEMDAQVKAVDEGFVTAIPVTAALSYDDAIVNKRIARHETAKPEAARSAAYQAARSIDVFYAQGASSEIARDINRDLVLELIRFHQPVSRVDLARRSGLQPSTISSIVEELVTEQWVEAGAIVQGSRGRPSTTLSLNPDMVTLALDLRPDRAIVAIVDLSGRFRTGDDPHCGGAKAGDRPHHRGDVLSARSLPRKALRGRGRMCAGAGASGNTANTASA